MHTGEAVDVQHHSFLTSASNSDIFNFTFSPLSWGKCPQHPLHRKLSGPQLVCCEEQTNLLLLPVTVSQFFSSPSHTLITIQTTPPQQPSESRANDNSKTFLREWRCWKYFSWKQTRSCKQFKAVECEILVVVKDVVENIRQKRLMVYSLSYWQHHEISYKQNRWYVSHEKCSCNKSHCWNSYKIMNKIRIIPVCTKNCIHFCQLCLTW